MTKTKNSQRVYGMTTCERCDQRVEVVYPYTNSDESLGLIDHETRSGKRCQHAGLSIWTKRDGWVEDKLRQRYGEASIDRESEAIDGQECRFTPGPWIAIPSNIRFLPHERPIFDDGLWRILPEYNLERLPICVVDRANDHNPPSRAKAEYDAHLIAAAPDLYAVVAAIVSAWNQREASNDLVARIISERVIPDAIKALSKARGESMSAANEQRL